MKARTKGEVAANPLGGSSPFSCAKRRAANYIGCFFVSQKRRCVLLLRIVITSLYLRNIILYGGLFLVMVCYCFYRRGIE